MNFFQFCAFCVRQIDLLVVEVGVTPVAFPLTFSKSILRFLKSNILSFGVSIRHSFSSGTLTLVHTIMSEAEAFIGNYDYRL